MDDYLRLIDTHTPGRRCDVTPLFADPLALARLVADLSAPFADVPFDFVAGIDALGFVLGAAMALYLRKGFIPLRKADKLPVPADRAEFVDYTGECKALELRVGAIRPGQKVLLVDEWIETGAQVQAAIELLERQGAIVLGIAAINVDDNDRTRSLRQRYRCHALWHSMAPPPG